MVLGDAEPLVFRVFVPSLTRLLEILDVEEATEEMESWLPLRSRDKLLNPVKPRPTLLMLPLFGVDGGASSRATLCIGANRPYNGLQSKYL